MLLLLLELGLRLRSRGVFRLQGELLMLFMLL